MATNPLIDAHLMHELRRAEDAWRFEGFDNTADALLEIIVILEKYNQEHSNGD
jgi:hypothetical protein